MTEEYPASIFKHIDTEDTVDPHTSQELSDKEPIVHCPTTVLGKNLVSRIKCIPNI